MKYLTFLFLLALPLLAAPAPPALSACSQAVHDKYMVLGPDGVAYPTWHPQIDTWNGCVFDHEHGSDPALFDPTYHPLYGYSAAHHGMTEGHSGFKGYALQLGGYRWYITQHQGTAHPEVAACVRMHTLDLAVKDTSLIADIHLMADFGRAVENASGKTLTTGCVQTQGPGTGIRQFPTAPSGSIGYEPWRADAPGNMLGLTLANVTFNTKNPQAGCDALSCTAALARTDAYGPARGTWRELTLYAGFGIRQTGAYSGTFQTDAMGAGPGDVQQFIRPGADARLAAYAFCVPWNAYAYSYDCGGTTPNGGPFWKNPFITGAN